MGLYVILDISYVNGVALPICVWLIFFLPLPSTTLAYKFPDGPNRPPFLSSFLLSHRDDCLAHSCPQRRPDTLALRRQRRERTQETLPSAKTPDQRSPALSLGRTHRITMYISIHQPGKPVSSCLRPALTLLDLAYT